MMAEKKSEYITIPYSLAMVVCDHVWRDPYTRKMTLLGTFSSLGGSEFPLRHPILCAYISLTDGLGNIPLKLRLIDVDENREPLFELSEEYSFTDPRTIYEIVFQAHDVEIPSPGEYRLQLFAGEEFIIERRILAVNQALLTQHEQDS